MVWLFAHAGASVLGFTLVPALFSAIVSGAGQPVSAPLRLSVTPSIALDGDTIVANTVTLSASVEDDASVAGLQFKLGRWNAGPELTAGACEMLWNTRAVPDGKYPVTAVVRDDRGAVTNSGVVVVTIENDAPTISWVAVARRRDSASIGWSTTQATTSRIEYGTAPAYGQVSLDETPVRAHRQVLGDLLPGTVYHFRVVATGAGGAATTSRDYSFVTPE